MLSESLFDLKVDRFSFFSFHSKSNDARIDNDGQVLFHKEETSIECGDGPLIYGISSGILDDMIRYIKWILLSHPIELCWKDRMGEYFYLHCADRNCDNITKYMFLSGRDCIVWLYKISAKEYYFEVTVGSQFHDPATTFRKIHSGVLLDKQIKRWDCELTEFKGLITIDGN